MNDISISVIIPTFNRLWSLPQAIESCRKIKCSHEIIVVDDGSTDGTWEWLQKQDGIRAFRQSNWGKDWAVNYAFSRATGQYVRFLDSDDWLLDNTSDDQFACALKSNADVIVAGYKIFNEQQNKSFEMPWVLCDDFIAQQLGECDSSHYSAYLFKRSFIENIPHRQEFGIRDDRMFIIEVALQEPQVIIYKKPAFVHRQHPNERMQFPCGLREVQTNVAHIQIYKKAATILKQSGKLTQRRCNAMAKALWPIAHWMARTHLEEACKTANWIYILNPEFEPPEKGLLGLLYKKIGFRATEIVLALRRMLLNCIKYNLIKNKLLKALQNKTKWQNYK